MDALTENYINIVIGLLTLAGIALVILKQPRSPKLSRWISEHRSQVETAAPFVFFLWGGVIWAALVYKSEFSNAGAMVAATILICIGVYFFFKRFIKR